jgi:hypothetical protein
MLHYYFYHYSLLTTHYSLLTTHYYIVSTCRLRYDVVSMAKKQNSIDTSFSLTQVSRTLYGLLGVMALATVIFDAGNLITKEAVIDRWTALFILFVINTIAWFIASEGTAFSKRVLTFLLSLTLLGFAGAMTYWERGMASTSTILYTLPLLSVAILKNRHALVATTGLCIATYAYTSVKYFNDYFNEGYRIQLWGSIVMYSGLFVVVSWIIMILTGLRRDSK